MQTAEDARTATNDALTGLTYVDTLVSGATAQGLASIMVEAKYLTDDTITAIRALGYTVNATDKTSALIERMSYRSAGASPIISILGVVVSRCISKRHKP